MGKRKREATRKKPADFSAMDGDAERAGALLKGMASTPRLRVLCNLAGGERSVGELLEEIPLSPSALSQHLAVLRREGLVTTRRSAQTIHYALAEGPVLEIMTILQAAFCGRGAPSRPAKRRP